MHYNQFYFRRLNTKFAKLAIFILPLLFNSGVVWAKGNIEAGKQKSATCVACHNADGNSTTPAWPKIAGQHENYLTRQVKEIQKGDKGKRNNPAMLAIIANLSEQDIEDLSAYFASQKQSPGQVAKNYVELGQKIYKGGNLQTGVPACSACHGPQGKGNDSANYPRIGGQHADYTEAQLKAFKAGTRSNDANEIMRNISAKMTDDEIKAVSSYISGLN